LDKKFEAAWEVIKEQKESEFAGYYLTVTKFQRSEFVRQNIDIIGLFTSSELVLRIEDAIDAGEQPTRQSLESVIQSPLGITFYKEQVVCLYFLNYRQAIHDGIQTLYHHDFVLDEYQHFVTLMKRQVDFLEGVEGHTFKCDSIEVRFCTVENMKLSAANLNDIWKRCVDAEIISVGINNGQLEKLPHEKLLWPLNGEMVGVATTFQLPEELIAPHKKVRHAAMSFLGDDCSALRGLVRCFGSKTTRKELMNQNRSWDLMDTFLMNHAETLMESKLGSLLVGGVHPVETPGQIPFKDFLGVVAEVKASPLTHALSLTFTKTVNSIGTLIENMSRGESPETSDVAKWSALHQKILKACESWCHVVKICGAKSSIVCGREALAIIYDDAANARKDDKNALTNDLGQLRMFEWMLSDDQQKTVAHWVKMGVKHARATASLCIADDQSKVSADKKESALVPVVPGTSSSASKGVVNVLYAGQRLLEKTAKGAKASKASDAETMSKSHAMQRLFGMKVQSA